jgi:hypothetical protein
MGLIFSSNPKYCRLYAELSIPEIFRHLWVVTENAWVSQKPGQMKSTIFLKILFRAGQPSTINLEEEPLAGIPVEVCP